MFERTFMTAFFHDKDTFRARFSYWNEQVVSDTDKKSRKHSETSTYCYKSASEGNIQPKIVRGVLIESRCFQNYLFSKLKPRRIVTARSLGAPRASVGHQNSNFVFFVVLIFVFQRCLEESLTSPCTGFSFQKCVSCNRK